MYSILKPNRIFKSSHYFRSLCWLIACLLIFGATSSYPRNMNADTGDQQTHKLFFPYIEHSSNLRGLATNQDVLFDLVWHRGNINLGPGVGGMEVIDWDGYGANELLMANTKFLFAIVHRGDYLFDQIWSVPSGVAWGIADVNDDEIHEIWVLEEDGNLVAYTSYNYQPDELGSLFADSDVEIIDATWADLQNNGEEQLVVLQKSTGQHSIHAYSTNGFTRLWHFVLPDMQNMIDCQIDCIEMAIGQVDDDPTLEIVLNAGHVFDPSELALQWSYNEGFGRRIALADVDRDGRSEIISSLDSTVTAFDADLKTSAWQFAATRAIDALHVADITDDDFPEIIVGYRQRNRIEFYDAETHQSISSVHSPEFGVSGITVGDVNNDDTLDLIWGAGWGSTGEDHLHLTPITQDAPAFTSLYHEGTYQVRSLQMDGDESSELAYLAHENPRPYYDFSSNIIIDGATGTQELDLSMSWGGGLTNYNGFDSLSGNIDNDPYEELLVYAGVRLYLFDHNGEWLLGNKSSGLIEPKWIGDVDGDGMYELVSIGYNKIKIHTIETLELEWQSEVFSEVLTELAVGDVDSDQQMEIVFYDPDGYLRAYDGHTKQQDWQMSVEQNVQALAIGNIDSTGASEIVTLEGNQLKFYNGQNQALIASTFQIDSPYYTFFPVQIEIAHLIATTQPQLIMSGYGHVYLFKAPLDSHPAQIIDTPVDNYPAGVIDRPFSNVAWYDVDNDQHMDLFISSTLGMTRYRARNRLIDTIAPTVHHLYPEPDRDLMTRDAVVEAKFSEDMDQTTLTDENIQLRDNDSSLPLRIEYMPDTRIVQLIPDDLLPNNENITVWFGPELQDIAGNGLDGNFNFIGNEPSDAYTWQFTTGNGIDDKAPTISQLHMAPSPAWLGMPISLTAFVDDTHPDAASTIKRVDYFLDVPSSTNRGIPMNPQDGQFDERSEELSVVLDTTDWQGEQVIYLQAEDSVGNRSEPISITLTIQSERLANWPTYGQNAAHTGYNSSQPPVTSYTLAWEHSLSEYFPTFAWPLTQVAVANDIVVASANTVGHGGIVALNTQTGERLWQRPKPNGHTINPPAIAAGIVYFHQGNSDTDSFLFALNILTGEQLWQAPLRVRTETHMAPTIADGKVFFNAGPYSDGMYAIDAFEGHQLWSWSSGSYSEWTPAYHLGRLYTWRGGIFSAWNPEDGTELWSIDLGWSWSGSSMERTIAITGTTAFVTAQIGDQNNNEGALVAIDLEAETEKWRVDGKYTSTPAVADSIVYAMNGSQLDAYDINTQALLHSFESNERLMGAPIVTAGNIFISSRNRTWCLDRNTLEEMWAIDKGGWLSVANNQLFIAQPNTQLATYDLE